MMHQLSNRQQLAHLAAAFLGGLAFLTCTAGNAAGALRHGVIWFSQAPSQEVRSLAAERYDVGITGLNSGADRLAVKTLNPNFRWYVYNSISDNYVPPHTGIIEEHEALTDLATQRGWDPEEVYMHYWDDTTIVLEGETLFVPGWGGGTASDPAQSRVPVFSSGLVRRATNFSTVRARQLHKETNIRMLLDVPFPGTTLYADGISFDNSSGRLFNRGVILSGGHIREMTSRDHVDSSEFRDWYFDGVLTFLSAMKDTLQTSAGWSRDGRRKELMINIANAWDDAYVTRDVADILMMEFQYNAVRNAGLREIDEAYRRDALASSAGISSFYSATMTRSVAGHVGEYTYDETLLNNFAWYLLTRTPTTYFYQQGTNLPTATGWDSLTWCGAMDVAPAVLGEPVGPPYLYSSGTDPLGNPFEIKARNYSGGLVLLRNRGNWSEGIEVETGVDVALPSALHRFLPDGSRGTAVGRLTLRNGQGAILAYTPDAVTLLAFTAERAPEGAWIRWEIAEEPLAGTVFHIDREDPDGTRRRLTREALAGDLTYAWLDPDPLPGPTSYWLVEVAPTGENTWYGPAVLAALGALPGPVLAQNEPNPFRISTSIRFTVAQAGFHSLTVYDVAGREIARLFAGRPAAGAYEIRWDGRDRRGVAVAPGVYFYSLRTPARTLTHKLLFTP